MWIPEGPCIPRRNPQDRPRILCPCPHSITPCVPCPPSNNISCTTPGLKDEKSACHLVFKGQLRGMDDWQQSVPSHLSDLADAVVADIKSKWAQMNAGPGVIESFKAFVAAVDWKVGGVGGLAPLRSGRSVMRGAAPSTQLPRATPRREHVCALQQGMAHTDHRAPA